MLHRTMLYDINSELSDHDYHFAMVLNKAFISIEFQGLRAIPLFYINLL